MSWELPHAAKNKTAKRYGEYFIRGSLKKIAGRIFERLYEKVVPAAGQIRMFKKLTVPKILHLR